MVHLETVKLKALLHIQKFTNWDEDPYSGMALPGGSWKPVSDTDGGAKVFLQTGSKMNDSTDFDDDESPF